jgi:hypothetical protein
MNEATPRDAEFPKAQLWDISYGNLHDLAIGARKTLGENAAYLRAIQAWYDDYVAADADAPATMNRAFLRRYKQAQAKLLLWCWVDEGRGIALTS